MYVSGSYYSKYTKIKCFLRYDIFKFDNFRRMNKFELVSLELEIFVSRILCG